MKAFVPYEKLSKKQKREIDKAKRATWGEVIPVTKRIDSAKIYNRKKHQRGGFDSGAGVFCL
jgi:hypothetical protein